MKAGQIGVLLGRLFVQVFIIIQIIIFNIRLRLRLGFFQFRVNVGRGRLLLLCRGFRLRRLSASPFVK